MLRFLFCCRCFSSENSNNESQPLLHPKSEVNGPESARKTRPAHSDVQATGRTGRLSMRRVNVPELDRRFDDVAEAFNEQQEQYEAMVGHIANLQQTCGCPNIDGPAFAECVRKIRDEHEGTYRVSMKMKGYDFFLDVVCLCSESEQKKEPLPPALVVAQNEVKGTSDSAKATISKGTTLQELIGWLLRTQDQMAEQVKKSAETYQEQGRLNENLEVNLRQIRRAKELSQQYRKQAGEVLIDVAEIAGARL